MPGRISIKSVKSTVSSLTPYEKLSLLISSLGLSVTFLGLLSLIFIYGQTRQTYESLSVSANQSITTQLLEVDKIFVDEPDLRQYFYDKADIDEHNIDYAKVLAVAEYELDFFDSALTQLRHMPDDQGREFWKKYIRDSFVNSPVLCKRLAINPDWYEPAFVADAKEAFSQHLPTNNSFNPTLR